MKTNIKNKLATGLMGALAVVTMATAMVMAPDKADAAVNCPPGSKNESADNYALCNMDKSQVGQSNSIWTTVNTVINVLLGVIGILAVVMVIYGGFKIVTSAGAADKVKSGRETILYGVVGLVIALLAFAIVNFVIGAFFNNGSTATTTGGGSGSGSQTEVRQSSSTPTVPAAQPPNN